MQNRDKYRNFSDIKIGVEDSGNIAWQVPFTGGRGTGSRVEPVTPFGITCPLSSWWGKGSNMQCYVYTYCV